MLKREAQPGWIGRWISVKDRLPDFLPGKDWSANVLVTDGETLRVFARCHEKDGWLWGNCYGFIDAEPETDDDYFDQVTHWMPLPSPTVTDFGEVKP